MFGGVEVFVVEEALDVCLVDYPGGDLGFFFFLFDLDVGGVDLLFL